MADELAISKKKIVIDGILNIIAAAMPVIVLQLIVFPIIAQKENVESYGLMVTIYAILMWLPGICGNAICNVRLVKNSKYLNDNIEGDFNYIIIKYGAISSVIVLFLFIYYYKGNDLIGICLSLVTAIITYLSAYYEVAFSIKLNFKYRLYLRIVTVLGYLFGLALFLLLSRWEVVFLTGQIFTITFIMLKSNLYKERFIKTKHFKTTEHDCTFLIIAGLLASSLDYTDRLILLPLLGGRSVSIYYISALMGKLITFVIPPIKTLILSYLSRIDKLKKKYFYLIILSGILFSIIMYIICIALSPIIIRILYPQYAEEVLILIPIVTIAAIISGISSIIQVFVMRYCEMKWQMIINGISVTAFFAFSLIFLQIWGIMGFCIGNIIAYSIKLISFIIVLLFNHKLKGEEILC